MSPKSGGELAVGRVFVCAYQRADGHVVDAHTRAYPGDAHFSGVRCSFSYVRGSRLETRLAALERRAGLVARRRAGGLPCTPLERRLAALERRAELVVRRRAGGLPCTPTSVPMEQT